MIAIRGFIEQIIYLAIVTIIIELILPKGNTKKYVYSILSLFLLLNLISPVINIIRDLDMQSIYQDVLDNISIGREQKNEDAIAVFAEYKNEKITNELKEQMIKDIQNKLTNMNVEIKDIDIDLNETYDIEKIRIDIENLDYLGANRDKKILDIILILENEYELKSNSIIITEEAD